ncbi:MAG: M20/M25/M40 family metallo-hydrolase [bacterium]|nr:M20/M25/M40 family metallo-hydrolase [bacterium]MCP5071289.1 M20/M25/M40 family metallo-hydrolase [bacterium]
MHRFLLLALLAVWATAGSVDAQDVEVDAQIVARHLAEAIRFPTVSHQDPSQFDGQPFEDLLEHLRVTYPRVHAHLEVERIAGYSLLLTWRGNDPGLAPALFMSHTDVVPVEQEALEGWTHPPFSGVIDEDFIWGRGAIDVKSGIIGWLEAAEALLAQGFEPNRTLIFAFGHDEEIGGEQGAAVLAATLRERGTKLAFLVDEGGFLSKDLGLIPGKVVAQISTAEKTYFTIHLTARSNGGHSSTPPAHTAVGKLATAIHRLEANPLPLRISEPVRDLFAALAPHLPWSRRLALKNLWLTGGIVARRLAEDPFQAAMLRTTTAATMISGGVKENVVPKRATATVNFRILPDETPEDVLAHVRDVIDDPEIEITSDTWSQAPRPGRVDALGYRVLTDAIHHVYPEAVVVPGMLLAATDTRHYADLAEDAYRFLGVMVTRAQIPSIHGTDERVGIESFANAVRLQADILRRAGTGSP